MPRTTYPVEELRANLHAALRALRVAQVHGWCRWGGQAPGPGLTRLPTHHLVMLDDGTDEWDLLDSVETIWELIGYADGLGQGHLIRQAVTPAPPPIIPLSEVADMWSLGLQRMGDIVERDGWWRLYLPTTKPRHAYEAEAAYRLTKWARDTGGLVEPAELAGADAREREWRDVEKTLPRRPDAPLEVEARDRPVNIREDLNAFNQRVMALRIGDSRGWYKTLRSTWDGKHQVEVSNVKAGREAQAEVRTLPPAGALPWLRGVAAAHRERDLITYREGL